MYNVFFFNLNDNLYIFFKNTQITIIYDFLRKDQRDTLTLLYSFSFILYICVYRMSADGDVLLVGKFNGVLGKVNQYKGVFWKS